MVKQKAFAHTINRLVISENFNSNSVYETTNGVLASFGRSISTPIGANFVVKSKQNGTTPTNHSFTGPIPNVSFKYSKGVNFTDHNHSIRSSRRLLRRVRRFEQTISSTNKIPFKTHTFGVYSKVSVFKPFSFIKLNKQTSVPVLINKELNASRIIQDWSNSFSNNSFKTSIVKALSVVIGSPVHIIIIPAYSFTRYARDLESVQAITRRKNELGSVATLESRPTSSIFLQHIADEIRGRFQYVAIQIPDLLRVSFVAIYFKNPTLLAQLFAITLGALPRNRKETQFLRFLLKIVKVFAAQRPEILGIRRRFKGRVNRWRRTKHVIGEKGLIPLYTYSARIEIGEAQAITRKGTLGIRIWLSYKNNFANSYRQTLISYIKANSRHRILINVPPNTSIFSKS